MEAILNGPNGPTQLGTNPLTIGRTPDNQLVVSDGKASSRHAEIRPMGQGYGITDLGSTNGTFVNGQQIERNIPRQLMAGDTIRIGDASYTYQVRNTQQPAQTIYADPNQGNNADYSATQASQQPYQATAYGGNPGPQGYQPTQQAGYNQDQQRGFPPPPPAPPYGQYNAAPQQASYTPPPPPYNPSSPPLYNRGPQYNPYQQYNSVPAAYPGGGIPNYVPPAPVQPGSGQKGHALRNIVLIALALLVIIGAASTFFVIHNSQVATDNANGTATATTRSNATATTVTQATGVARTGATATAVAQNANPYGGSGALAFVDLLQDNSGGHQWLEDTNCSFLKKTYQVSISTQKTFRSCFAKATNFSNFTYEVSMLIINGDCGGLSFRGDPTNDKEYFFEVCQDGSYAFYLYDGSHSKTLLEPATSSAIKGKNQINTIAVAANNGTMQLYVNNTSLQSVQDGTYTSGSIGVIAIDHQNATQVAYAAARVWQ